MTKQYWGQLLSFSNKSNLVRKWFVTLYKILLSPKCFIFVIHIFYCPSSFLMVRTRFFSVLAAWKYIVWWLIYFLTIASVVTTLVTLVSAHNHLNTPLVFSIVVSCLIYTTYSIWLDIHWLYLVLSGTGPFSSLIILIRGSSFITSYG